MNYALEIRVQDYDSYVQKTIFKKTGFLKVNSIILYFMFMNTPPLINPKCSQENLYTIF